MNTRFAFKVSARDLKTLCRCSLDFVRPQNFEQEYLKQNVDALFYLDSKDEGTQVEKEYATYLVLKYIEAYADYFSEESFYYDARYSVHTCLNHLRTFFIDNGRLPNVDEFYEITEEK